MRINLILSGVRDFDLLALLQHEQYQLGKEIRRALRMYVRGDIHRILLPDVRGAPQTVSTEQRRVSITLNDRLDADVIAWIEGIQAGCKSTAIKSVFRNMLEAPYLVGMDRMRERAGRLYEAKKSGRKRRRNHRNNRRKKHRPSMSRNSRTMMSLIYSAMRSLEIDK